MEFKIYKATEEDIKYAEEISGLYVESAKDRGTGIAQRSPEYLIKRFRAGNSIVALQGEELAGYCYIEVFSNEGYVSNSGLIVKPKFRGLGLAKAIKEQAVALAREKYPKAKLFGITTSDVVMKINSDLGYIPVSFKKLTDDDEFWLGCKSCANYEILEKNDRKLCLCTAMLAKSAEELENMKPNIPQAKRNENE
ncbi:MAG: GNAT family N-acetyltransferase [Bacteroidia bacterium]|nr:GNAT family N-acetyltransferase [Bacteroidia bacterium]